jgi:1,4-alpha-glucan branching enzyme
MRRSSPAGELAIVLHTHMPYVEGFGTWPFGEEWLWEAISGSYLPLLDLLEEGAPLTLSLTPVLCDQLEAQGVGERFEVFIDEVRRRTHSEDIAGLRENGFDELARELERSWSEYEGVLRRFRERGGDLLGAPRTRCCRCWQPTPGYAHRCRPALTPTAHAFPTAGREAFGYPSALTLRTWSHCSRKRACVRHAWS